MGTPPQHSPQTADQLSRAEGLCDVIVRPLFERAHHAVLVAARREDDDGRVTGLAHRAAHLVAAAVGQAEVDERGVECTLHDPFPRLRGGRGRLDRPSLGAQQRCERPGDDLFVFDEKHVHTVPPFLFSVYRIFSHGA